MSDQHPHRSTDELLDAFIAAWHAGEAPSADAYLAQAADARDELAELLGAFLQLAPSVDATPARAAELAADPLLVRIIAFEADFWDGREGTVEAPWGARLCALREAAGVSVAVLGERFAELFRLPATDSARAPQTLAALEAGELPSTGVAARAARALEELLSAPRGVLAAGAMPAFGAPLLRAVMPEDADQREQFTELLREVSDAIEFSEAAVDAGLVAGPPPELDPDALAAAAEDALPSETLDQLLLGQ